MSDNPLVIPVPPGPRRPVRVAPGVRERLAAYEESLPHDPCACRTCARAREILGMRHSCQGCDPCEHAGVFSRHVPGDPSRFNETEHCFRCGRDVPVCEL